jgi:hypothetical protein
LVYQVRLRILEEKRSGASLDEREALRHALTFIREDDQLVITRLDRPAHFVLDLSQITAEIAVKKFEPRLRGARLSVVIGQSIDAGSPTGRLLLHMLAAIGEFVRLPLMERAARGLTLACSCSPYGAVLRRRLAANFFATLSSAACASSLGRARPFSSLSRQRSPVSQPSSRLRRARAGASCRELE